MTHQKTDRETFINKYRRENRWAIPFLALGTVAMVAMPLLLETTVPGHLGAALLASLFVFGIARSFETTRGSDTDVLRDAGKRYVGLNALIGLGMVLFSIGTDADSKWVIWIAVILFTMQANEKRVAQARAFLEGKNEKMSLAAG